MELFFIAARDKYRFNSAKGLLNLEDLFDLPLKGRTEAAASLNAIAVDLHAQAQAISNTKVSFVDDDEDGTSKSPSTELTNKLEIVKYLIALKKADIKARTEAADKAAQRQRIDEALAARQDSKLANATEEELLAMREALK